MIVAVYADNRKKASKLIADFSKQLSGQGYEVDSLTVSLGNAPKGINNPYINSVYDIHSRYNHLEALNSFSKTNKVLFVIGQTIETIISQSKYFHEDKAFDSYISWISSLEQSSYLLPSVDINICETSTISTKKTLKKIKGHNNYQNILLYDGDINKTIKKIISYKPSVKTQNESLYKNLVRKAYGHRQPISIAKAANVKLANKQITKLRNRYIKTAGINSYGSFISLPLNCAVNFINYPESTHMHNASTDRVVSAITNESYYPPESIKFKFDFKNEVSLTEQVGKLYNASLHNISINKRRRLLETIVSNKPNALAANLNFVTINAKLSYYDFLLITNLIKVSALWELPSAKYGFIDVGDEKDSDLLEEIFDQTSFSANASNDYEATKYLLLGHINYFYISLDFYNTTLLLIKGSRLKGSEYLKKILTKLDDEFAARFPVIAEILKS